MPEKKMESSRLTKAQNKVESDGHVFNRRLHTYSVCSEKPQNEVHSLKQNQFMIYMVTATETDNSWEVSQSAATCIN